MYIPNVIVQIIAEYAAEDVLRDDINKCNLSTSISGVLDNPSPGVLNFILTNKIDTRVFNNKSLHGWFCGQTDSFVLQYYFDNYNYRYYNTRILSANTNNLAVKYMINYRKHLIKFGEFSGNTNPNAVIYLLHHPKKIFWKEFSSNTNDMAVAFCIQNMNKVDLYDFSLNSNDRAVLYLIDNPRHIDWNGFMVNTNKYAIRYLIHARHNNIIFRRFIGNKNPIVANYILLNHEISDSRYIYCKKFLSNALADSKSDKAINYIFTECFKYIDWSIFLSNDNDVATDLSIRYMLMDSEKREFALSCRAIQMSISKNKNTKMVEYLIDHPYLIDWESFASNPSIFTNNANQMYKRLRSIYDDIINPELNLVKLEISIN